MVPEAPNRFDVLGFKPTDWSGLQLHSNGTYTLRVVPSGIARAGAGAGAGASLKELKVDCRVTVSGSKRQVEWAQWGGRGLALPCN